ncbi:MAG: dihydrodipicolinate reductase [Candidatus Marinimicrobia bacterium]|nr:dihydrodipicolinate reductase [Candidatus Neomarinimicrobiota bacterium]
MGNSIRVVQLGLGYIGLAVHEILKERPAFEIVGLVDTDPAKAGDLPGYRISAGVGEALAETSAQVAVVTTTSRMESITPQVLDLVSRGLSVVSTCEELVYPWDSHPQQAAKIDAAARESGVAVLSTGVNPGFLMDFLPVVISRVARRVDSVLVERYQDAAPRREAFQRKIGAGLTVEQFQARVAGGNFGHAGLTASIQLLAAGLGWRLDKTAESIEPVIADRALKTDYLAIEPGQVAGVYQVGTGTMGDRDVIRLVFRAAVGEPKSYDRIHLEGDPPLESIFNGGVAGDVATGAITVNAIPLVLRLPPGLRTMADLWPAF